MTSIHQGVLTSIQWLLLDSVTALWVTFLALLVLIWLPSLSLPLSQHATKCDRTIEALSLSILYLVFGVLFLSAISLFNWFTLVLWYGGGLLALPLSDRYQQTLNKIRELGRQSLYFSFDVLDHQVSWKSVRWSMTQYFSRRWYAIAQGWHPRQGIRSELLPRILTFIVILSFTLLFRYEHPLRELRFSLPDFYSILLATRQILIGDAFKVSMPTIFSSLGAVLSLVGSVDPMYVLRFLSPLLGVALVLGVGYGVYVLMADAVAAVVTSFSLGAYLFTCSWTIPEGLPIWLHQSLDTLILNLNTSFVRQWTGSDPELGALFLILALTQLDRSLNRRQPAWLTIGCCSAIVVSTAPVLLVLVLLGSLCLVINREWTIGIVAIAWVLLALTATLPTHPQWLQPVLVTLPVGLSLLCGSGFALFSRGMQWLSGEGTQTASLILIFAISVNFLLPLSPNLVYVEYDITARETLALNNRFPEKHWMLVAPAEQLSQTLGDGWYTDLMDFVKQRDDRNEPRNFEVSSSVPDLFVFVEKRPFKTFQVEPLVISAKTAFDPVYMNYRTLAGRSSLQFEAMKLCETYRRTHPNTSIEYEDDTLRVYHFQLPKHVLGE